MLNKLPLSELELKIATRRLMMHSKIGRLWRPLTFVYLVLCTLFIYEVYRIWSEPIAAAQKQPSDREKIVADDSSPEQNDQKLDELSERGLRLQALKSEIDSLRTQLSAERDRLSALDNVSRIILTAGGVFALLLGVGSWVSVADQRRTAKDALDTQMRLAKADTSAGLEELNRQTKTALQEIEKMRDELRLDFPMFGRLRRNVSRVLDGLVNSCEGLEAQDDTYDRLDGERKQQIMFYERAIADTLLVDMRDYADQLAEIYRLLGIFYGSRYTYEYRSAKEQTPREQLERSQFYFNRAIDASGGKDAVVYEHAAYFATFYDDLSLCRRAREFLQSAIALDTQRQRPVVSLSLIELHAFKAPEWALQTLEKANTCKQWEEAGSKCKPQVVRYVRACALMEQANQTSDAAKRAALDDRALVELEYASVAPDEWIRANLIEGDYQAPPDNITYFVRMNPDHSLYDRYQKAYKRIGQIAGECAV